jgi:hypothetical protein
VVDAPASDWWDAGPREVAPELPVDAGADVRDAADAADAFDAFDARDAADVRDAPDARDAPDVRDVVEARDAVPIPDVPPPPMDRPPTCLPQPEICNGADDDCDGIVDEDLVPIPCPQGGSRYCVGGRFSDCPRRCEVCIPGSRRVCMISFCLYWGSQTCSADGRGFGPCLESPPPKECKAIADRQMKSRELEQCCLDNGYCCLDEFDLDGDGDRSDMLGRCEAVRCE